ncbi:HEPN domain-containing protein [Stratiformator vulcanicus]|uniref:HEPN domain-containing protein n=1 Tax=Stratiformator vulcanicus TaxID=2527980 RepID=UPI002877AF20|nr:HEPN domain-containing protein [Stratiformator vulcanicus]
MRLYRGLAVRRREDADVLVAAERYSGAIYLGGYVAECVLKALILRHTAAGQETQALNEVKSIGHNLERLKTRAIETGSVHFPAEVIRALNSLNYWSSELRYDLKTPGRKDVSAFFRALKVIGEWSERVSW